MAAFVVKAWELKEQVSEVSRVDAGEASSLVTQQCQLSARPEAQLCSEVAVLLQGSAESLHTPLQYGNYY